MGNFIVLYIPDFGEPITDEMNKSVGACADYLKEKVGSENVQFVIAESIDTLIEHKNLLNSLVAF